MNIIDPKASVKAPYVPAQKRYRDHDKVIPPDPDLDTICGYIVDSQMSLFEIEEATEKAGRRVSRYTLIQWLYGNTMNPHNSTMTAVMAALGYQKQWIKVEPKKLSH